MARGPDAPPREVVVSFGDATLVLTDLGDRPLGHWVLVGVQAVGKDGPATVYAMTPEGEETLTIEDAAMVEAIAAVSRPFHGPSDVGRPRGRGWWPAAIAAILIGLAAAFLPELIRAQAARMAPPEMLGNGATRCCSS